MMRALLVMVFIFALLFASRVLGAQTSQAEKKQLRAAITREALKNGLDPVLVIAVAKVESGLNPNAVGLHGEQGLFQLRPKYHKDASIEVAVQYLSEVRSRCLAVYQEAWVNCYNRGPFQKKLKAPKKFKYFLKVKEAMREEKKGALQC